MFYFSFQSCVIWGRVLRLAAWWVIFSSWCPTCSPEQISHFYIIWSFSLNETNHLASCPVGIARSPWQQTLARHSGSSTCRGSSIRRRGRCSTRGRTSPSSRPCSSSPSTGNAWGRLWTAKPSTTTHLSLDTWRYTHLTHFITHLRRSSFSLQLV